MQELEITCRCPSLRVPSLGLVLVQGDVVYVPATHTGNEELRQAGAGLSIRPVTRFVEQRAPQPLPVRVPRPAPQPVAAIVQETLAPVVGQVLTPSLKAEMISALKEVLAGLVVAPQGPVVVTVANTASGVVAPIPVRVADEPVFIPSGLVDPAAKVDITAQKSSTDGGSLDEASQALKKARRR